MSLTPLFFDAFDSVPRPDKSAILRPDARRGSDHLRELLAARAPTELTAEDIRTDIEGSLSDLAPEAFRYFLPGLMHVSLTCYESVSVFVSELVSALTRPSRDDVVEALDRAAQILPRLGLSAEAVEQLRKQQLDWFDSGNPLRIFRERVDALTAAEGAAVLAFFVALERARGRDFPFGELAVAIDRHWNRYGGR